MRYFAKFDDKGERVTSVVEGVHFDVVDDVITPAITEGFIEITEAEQQLYCTGKYIRGADGKPIERPAYQLTLEELKQQKYAKVNNTYSTKEEQILKAISQAQAMGDTSTVTKLNATFVANREAWKAEILEIKGE